jgi:predicted alpha/beta-fold hydrolase
MLLITAQDDPFVPFSSFKTDYLKSEFVQLLAPKHGGHAGFFGRMPETSGLLTDRFWAENRVVEFCSMHS